MRSLLILLLLLVLATEGEINRDFTSECQDLGGVLVFAQVAPDTPHLVWKYEIPHTNLVTSCIGVSNRIVQLASNGVVCLDEDGREVWKFEEGGCAIILEDKVLIGDGDDLYCLSLEDGSIIWKEETAIASGSPVEAEDQACFASVRPDIVFVSPPSVEILDRLFGFLFGCKECMMSCHNVQTGEQLWTYHEKRDIRSISYNQGRFIVLLKGGGVYSLDVKTREKVWHLSSGKPHGRPSINGNEIAFVDDSFVYCLDNETGGLFWKFPITEGLSPEMTRGLVFVHSSDGFLYCIDEYTGELVWKASTWLDNPQELWTNIPSPPVFADGKVFVGSSDTNIYCFDAETGTLLWKYALGGPIVTSPAVIEGNVYVSCFDGSLYAFGIDPETYFQKAQNYVEKKNFEDAEKYCMKAREWYLRKGDPDGVVACDEFMEVLREKIREYSLIEESVNQAQHYFDEGNEALLRKRFGDALEFYDLSRALYEGIHNEDGAQRCYQRIDYIKARDLAEKTDFSLFFVIIAVILACIVMILLRTKQNS